MYYRLIADLFFVCMLFLPILMLFDAYKNNGSYEKNERKYVILASTFFSLVILFLYLGDEDRASNPRQNTMAKAEGACFKSEDGICLTMETSILTKTK